MVLALVQGKVRSEFTGQTHALLKNHIFFRGPANSCCDKYLSGDRERRETAKTVVFAPPICYFNISDLSGVGNCISFSNCTFFHGISDIMQISTAHLH